VEGWRAGFPDSTKGGSTCAWTAVRRKTEVPPDRTASEDEARVTNIGKVIGSSVEVLADLRHAEVTVPRP